MLVDRRLDSHGEAVGILLVADHLHRLRHEPFDTVQEEWSHTLAGPLSGANGALPWIIFERDRGRFQKGFPSSRIDQLQPIMPFRYVLSCGVSMRQLVPSFAAPVARGSRAGAGALNGTLGDVCVYRCFRHPLTAQENAFSPGSRRLPIPQPGFHR